jgi:hypothetical protein
MTSELVRVFRTDGEYQQDRIAVWDGRTWIELEATAVDVIDSESGPLASVILPVHVGHDSAPPAPYRHKSAHADVTVFPDRETAPAGAPLKMIDLQRDAPFQRGGLVGSPASLTPAGEVPSELPVWGDKDKPRVRFFTITDASGKVYPNNSTDVAGSDAKAAEYLRNKWNKLTAGVSGRAAVKVELQPEGRIGSDRPDIAPPKGVRDIELQDIDEDGPAQGE